MRISYGAGVRMEGRKVGEQASMMGVSKGGGHGVTHGGGGRQCQM